MHKRKHKETVPSGAPSFSISGFETANQTRLQSIRRMSMIQSSVCPDLQPARDVPSPSGVGLGHATTNDSTSIMSPDYADLGSCNEVCEFCGALFWHEERLTSFPTRQRPRYHRCCRAGRVLLHYPVQPPDLLKSLFSDPHFICNIRAYNAMFSMTSFGATVNNFVNQGGSPYVFRITGQVSHWIGSVCPIPGDRPRFLQMYVFDGENEISNRLRLFNDGGTSDLSAAIVSALAEMLDEVNEYVKLFRTARELCVLPVIPNFSIKLFSRKHDRRYDSPSAGIIGAIVCDSYSASEDFDIIIRAKDNSPHRVSKLHPAYMPLQYPLLFPYAEQGWSPELQISSGEETGGRNLTPSMFYSYQIHDRQGLYTHILHAGRLFQQYIVDAYVCVEHSRLEYIRNNQQDFRCEFLDGVQDAICRGDMEASNVGQRVVLPSSFTGGPRYM